MPGRTPTEQPLPEDSTTGVEARLQSQLSPVMPDPEFVNRLRRNLAHPAETSLETPHKTRAFFVALGVSFSGILAIALAIRTVLLVLQVAGFIRPDEVTQPTV